MFYYIKLTGYKIRKNGGHFTVLRSLGDLIRKSGDIIMFRKIIMGLL